MAKTRDEGLVLAKLADKDPIHRRRARVTPLLEPQSGVSPLGSRIGSMAASLSPDRGSGLGPRPLGLR